MDLFPTAFSLRSKLANIKSRHLVTAGLAVLGFIVIVAAVWAFIASIGSDIQITRRPSEPNMVEAEGFSSRGEDDTAMAPPDEMTAISSNITSGEASPDALVVASSDNANANASASLASDEAFVHVGGAVKRPGVYRLPAEARVCDAVEAAGGFVDDACSDYLNLARKVNDGEQIIVPTQVEVDALGTPWTTFDSMEKQTGSGLNGNPTTIVNINTANVGELQTLDGVGEATAKKIVADREAHGPFKTLEDLKRVPGIGEKKFEALKPFITL